MERADRNKARPAPSPSVAPATGLCTRLNLQVASDVLGERFDVAVASGTDGQAQSCVVRRAASPLPRMTLARQPVSMTADDFRQDFRPQQAVDVTELGEAAYSIVVAAADGAGPRIEVGWTAGGVVSTLEFEAPATVNQKVVEDLVPALVVVARAT